MGISIPHAILPHLLAVIAQGAPSLLTEFKIPGVPGILLPID